MNDHLIRCLGLIGAALLSSHSLAAEDLSLPVQVSLPQLIGIAREQSPRYSMALARMDAAEAEVIGAGVLPNPKITYGRYDLASRHNTMYDGPSQQEWNLEIPLPISGQRGARLATAERR